MPDSGADGLQCAGISLYYPRLSGVAYDMVFDLLKITLNYLPSLIINRVSQSFRNILVGCHACVLAWLPIQNFFDAVQHYTLVCIAEERNGIALGNKIRVAGRFHNLVRRSSQLVVGPALKHLQERIRNK
jgi:hypothetical protein